MCGIAGIFYPTLTTGSDAPSSIDRDLLQRMNGIQSHRGPDDDGFHYAPGIGLAHRRLSIIDLSGGHQPLYNEDKTVCVVFNGEIYNYPELSQELNAKGHQFQTHSDTETIVHAWEEWGEQCVERFRGMFSFAVWDETKQQLFIARDRLGIKPLYYSVLDDGAFIFGSELKVLKQHPDLPRKLDPRAIEDYFTFGYIPEPKTIFQGVFKLEPGHSILLDRKDNQAPQPKQYWDIPGSDTPLTYADTQKELVERLSEAVKIRMVAEVPLGAFLSGGVDSSAVVALMAKLQDSPVNTCSIGFDVKDFNETEYAQQVADRYQTRHHSGTVIQDDVELIDQLAELYDEPYADSSAMPTYRVCELARKHVTVALSGDGGDELFAGYSRYRWHLAEEKKRNLLPLSLRRPLFGFLGKTYPKLDKAPRFLRAKTTFQSMALDSVAGYHNSIAILREDARSELFSDTLKNQLNGYNSLDVFRHHQANAPSSHPLKMLQYIDMKTYLVGDILTKVDRASMAHSLEVRVPLLDHPFVEWAFQAEPEATLVDQEGKYCFKKALEPLLPHDVLYRKKMGFAVPLAKWFRGSLQHKLRESLLSGIMTECGLFNEAHMKTLIDQHVSGLKDHSSALWTLMMFAAFLQKNAA